MKPILEVRNLWKEYKIGSKQKRYKSLRDSLITSFKTAPKTEFFWALQDINFDVHKGDCIGIIGRNGAGKSTLLKILSKITPPTKGHIKARGRIASLLEVGTGFHPELTGRENIYLNGSILGLRKSEIDRKFDEIVDFSGVEQFLDTSLKHYSSGMQLRLAFSVAAYLEPEILLIDEVLAVGDAEFQKKCLGKMDEISSSGRTIFFVSHNLDVIKQLCTIGILLDKGKIMNQNEIFDIVNIYTQTLSNHYSEKISDDYYFSLKSNSLHKQFKQFEPIFLSFQMNILQSILQPIFFDFAILNQNNETILHFHEPFIQASGHSFSTRNNVVNLNIESPNLLPGNYHLTIYVYDRNQKVYYWENLFNAFEIIVQPNIWNKQNFSILRSNTLPIFRINIK